MASILVNKKNFRTMSFTIATCGYKYVWIELMALRKWNSSLCSLFSHLCIFSTYYKKLLQLHVPMSTCKRALRGNTIREQSYINTKAVRFFVYNCSLIAEDRHSFATRQNVHLHRLHSAARWCTALIGMSSCSDTGSTVVWDVYRSLQVWYTDNDKYYKWNFTFCTIKHF